MPARVHSRGCNEYGYSIDGFFQIVFGVRAHLPHSGCRSFNSHCVGPTPPHLVRMSSSYACMQCLCLQTFSMCGLPTPGVVEATHRSTRACSRPGHQTLWHSHHASKGHMLSQVGGGWLVLPCHRGSPAMRVMAQRRLTGHGSHGPVFLFEIGMWRASPSVDKCPCSGAVSDSRRRLV